MASRSPDSAVLDNAVGVFVPPSDDGTTVFGFAPDSRRAAGLDQAVRFGLAHSLGTIFECLDPPFAPEPARVANLRAAIEAAPVSPGVFGLYTDLVVALFEERLADARRLADDVLAQSPSSEALRVVTLDDVELGPGQSERYRRFLTDDVQFVLHPVSGEARAQAVKMLDSAINLLRRGAPGAFGELQALIREIVLVTGRGGMEGPPIGGASTFSLWGALFLNVDLLSDRLTVAQALAHESAHSHLHGLTLGGRLVEDDGDVRYASPLRRDPRPMEGVIHATYVLARMIHVLRSLIDSGELQAAEVADARQQIVQHRAAYDDGLATVLAHARMTPPAAAAFEQMRRYMDGS